MSRRWGDSEKCLWLWKKFVIRSDIQSVGALCGLNTNFIHRVVENSCFVHATWSWSFFLKLVWTPPGLWRSLNVPHRNWKREWKNARPKFATKPLSKNVDLEIYFGRPCAKKISVGGPQIQIRVSRRGPPGGRGGVKGGAGSPRRRVSGADLRFSNCFQILNHSGCLQKTF